MIRGLYFFFLFLCFKTLSSQYTDQINSNRPGESIGAFSVGKNVLQFESGIEFRGYKHSGYNNSTFNAQTTFLSIRWGLLYEQLELTYDGVYMIGTLHSKKYSTVLDYKLNGFLKNFIGIKYLLFDPFKTERKENVYSWKANNGFKIRELIPAVSLTLGTNLNVEKNNPYPYGNVFSKLYRPIFYQNIGVKLDKEPILSFRGTLATQSHFLNTWVFVTNFNYNRFLSDYIEKSYILTLTHTFHPLWSIYIENEVISSDLYESTLFRSGAAYLFSNDIQIEASIGMNIKNSPSLLLANLGVSYRLDFHQDFQSAKELEEKENKKNEKKLKKSLKKTTKLEKKRNRRAKKN
jgi:hypothetical protein